MGGFTQGGVSGRNLDPIKGLGPLPFFPFSRDNLPTLPGDILLTRCGGFLECPTLFLPPVFKNSSSCDYPEGGSLGAAFFAPRLLLGGSKNPLIPKRIE